MLPLSAGLHAQTPPNIIVIMGDDIGWSNIGVYNQGIIAGRTPNLDRLANEGMRFTDYYAEASCTAGRANFITGELPIRTGLTTVGQAGSPLGIRDEAVTIAQVLKVSGYATGQFGKNHLGDLNKFQPTVHGFDEFFGYLYHLDAMEDPSHRNYPPALKDVVGPRNTVHSWATEIDDPAEQPRWGKIGKQRIEDAGTLCPKRMETVDDEIHGIVSGLDWFPTLVAAAGNPNVASELLTGKKVGDQTFKVHLDGYNQLDLITGKGPSARHEIFYLTETTLAAVRIDDYKYRFTDQPDGWLGATEKVDRPILTNLRLDPYERTGMFNGKDNGSIAYYNWFAYEFWRFVFVQQEVAKAPRTLIEFPPMQAGASFNMSAVKEQIEKAIAARSLSK